MKLRLFLVMALGLWGSLVLAGNYLLTIDGKPYELDIGELTTATLQNGQKVQVKLEKKDIATFKTEMFSFNHPSGFAPSKTDLGDGVYQTIMATPTGTMVMIQEYTGLNPCGLIDMIVTELTKEEVHYGYTITKRDVSKKLADGQTVTGKFVVSKYRKDENQRNVLCYGAKDAGLVIVTQLDNDTPSEDMAMMDLFWKTLTILVK